MTLIQTLKVEAFPVLLYGKKFWGGLKDWMTETLIPNFIDGEDIDIFRVVDSPEEAVKLIRKGVKTHWWKPEDEELRKAAGNGSSKKKGPMAGGKSSNTGEGTRYGSRPQRTGKRHAAAGRKAEQ